MDVVIITEKRTYPVRYEDILVFPEYFMEWGGMKGWETLNRYKEDDIKYYIVGVGTSYEDRQTTVFLLNQNFSPIGIRQKISIFIDEPSLPSTSLVAYNISKNRRIGIIICREILHTAIAEVYRMMGVNIVAVSIGGGDFWGLQRQSWIDQMTLFHDIVKAPLICSCGATKEGGGINLIIN